MENVILFRKFVLGFILTVQEATDKFVQMWLGWRIIVLVKQVS